jgi:hypothetical protein
MPHRVKAVINGVYSTVYRHVISVWSRGVGVVECRGSDPDPHEQSPQQQGEMTSAKANTR